MKTVIEAVSQASVERAAQLIRGGEVVGVPTETVYGLAANALDGRAVTKIFLAKGRPQDNPLISHIASLEMLEGLWERVTPEALTLAKAFWPGPLTIVLPRGKEVSDEVCAGLPTAAVRWPSHPVAQAVIRASGVPFAAPSANLSGSPSPTTARDVFTDLQGRIPLILDGGACGVGVESTVISLAAGRPEILRPGHVTREQLEAVLERPVALAGAVTKPLKEGERAASPGMKYKHYAPKAEIVIVKGSRKAYTDYVNARVQDGVFALCFEEERDLLRCPCVTYGRETDEDSQARELFSALRRLDEQGARLAYARCPREEGVALAVYNRLLRAAAFRVVVL